MMGAGGLMAGHLWVIWAGAGPLQPPEALSPQALAPIKGPQGSQQVLEGSWPQGRHFGSDPITLTMPVSLFSPIHSATCFLLGVTLNAKQTFFSVDTTAITHFSACPSDDIYINTYTYYIYGVVRP